MARGYQRAQRRMPALEHVEQRPAIEDDRRWRADRQRARCGRAKGNVHPHVAAAVALREQPEVVLEREGAAVSDQRATSGERVSTSSKPTSTNVTPEYIGCAATPDERDHAPSAPTSTSTAPARRWQRSAEYRRPPEARPAATRVPSGRCREQGQQHLAQRPRSISGAHSSDGSGRCSYRMVASASSRRCASRGERGRRTGRAGRAASACWPLSACRSMSAGSRAGGGRLAV